MCEPLTAISAKIVEETSKTPVIQRTFDNLLYCFFHKPNLKAEMLRIEDSVLLNQYEEKLKIGYQTIPDDQKLPPKRCITDRALVESLYYIEEADLRSLFENLILSSVDLRYIKHNHPAFIDIIKQLSPLDARNLKLFRNKNSLPLVDYIQDYPKGRFNVFCSDVFLENPDEQDIELQSISIRNLARLALIELPEKQLAQVDDDSLYSKYKESSLYLDHLDKFNSGKLPSNVIGINMLCSYASVTSFGKSFITTCVR